MAPVPSRQPWGCSTALRTLPSAEPGQGPALLSAAAVQPPAHHRDEDAGLGWLQPWASSWKPAPRNAWRDSQVGRLQQSLEQSKETLSLKPVLNCGVKHVQIKSLHYIPKERPLLLNVFPGADVTLGGFLLAANSMQSLAKLSSFCCHHDPPYVASAFPSSASLCQKCHPQAQSMGVQAEQGEQLALSCLCSLWPGIYTEYLQSRLHAWVNSMTASAITERARAPTAKWRMWPQVTKAVEGHVQCQTWSRKAPPWLSC